MIEIQKLSYSIPEKDLYKKVTFTIEDNVHYAFIGSNGTGKSTLMEMLINPDKYLYDGKIKYDDSFRESRIGYVSQFSYDVQNEDMTVYEYISQEFVDLDNKIAELCEKMAVEEDLEQIFDEYQKVLDEKEAVDGDHYDINIKKQLKIANISNLEQHTLSSLSGGEFKLVQVIKEMLLSPKVIMMDEPDAFLDFEHVNALRDLINAHKGTLVVITHNRYLLNHCFNGIIHLENCDIQQFEGTYEEYRYELLETKIDLEEAAAKDEEEINRQKAIVDKMRARATAIDNASFGRVVHARQTLLDRLENRKTKLPFIDIKKPNIKFNMFNEVEVENADDELQGAEQDEKIMIELKDYNASFDTLLLENVNLQIKSSDKVAIVGKNGTGKTTLLKDIIENTKDSVNVDKEARISMFSQVAMASDTMVNAGDSIRMDLDKTAYQILEEKDFEKTQDIFAYMKQYGFGEDELYKRVRDMSGGEKDLFQLAVMALEESNVLLLDEPTGHLDLYSQVALENAIKEYKGGVIMVSHDFYIVANCMDYVLLVEEDNLRKMSIRKFRQMIYKNYFDKDYLLKEDKKKETEMRIEALLQKKDFEKAKTLMEDLKK